MPTTLTINIPLHIMFYDELPKDATADSIGANMVRRLSYHEDGRGHLALETLQALVGPLVHQGIHSSVVQGVASRVKPRMVCTQRNEKGKPVAHSNVVWLVAEKRLKNYEDCHYIRVGEVTHSTSQDQ